MQVRVRDLARARSGDKGTDANIGVVARSSRGYALLQRELTEERVHTFFKPLGVRKTKRYLLPNLEGINFVLGGVLDPLRIDAQGKALGQALLELPLEISEEEWNSH